MYYIYYTLNIHNKTYTFSLHSKYKYKKTHIHFHLHFTHTWYRYRIRHRISHTLYRIRHTDFPLNSNLNIHRIRHIQIFPWTLNIHRIRQIKIFLCTLNIHLNHAISLLTFLAIFNSDKIAIKIFVSNLKILNIL